MVLTFKPEVDRSAKSDDINLPCKERRSDSPFVELVWHSRSDKGGAFISMAESHWEMVVTKCQGRTTLTIRGPETRATPAFSPPEAEFCGIVFKAGAFMPNFPASMVMDRRDLNLPLASGKSFWLNGSAWQFPNFENADTFINRLVREGLLVHDPVIEVALREQPHTLSRRTIQRRFLQATGLTYNAVYQIQRARYAITLLKQGLPILDVVEMAGYSDQPHMTRALKYLIGHTPAQIVSKNTAAPMSFLFKTLPF
ncbi:MAG: helix-turn-helix transcriptional regulator [Chloroflexi bacterium]|nr:helix-turn-helix transcriptional regulator [Chloroflexota bacterium]